MHTLGRGTCNRNTLCSAEQINMLLQTVNSHCSTQILRQELLITNQYLMYNSNTKVAVCNNTK